MQRRSFLIDINGVLYTGRKPVEGASDTVEFLREEGYDFRFITNATQSSRETLCKKLSALGFGIRKDDIFSSPVATARYIKESGRTRCFLLTTGDVRKDFEREGIKITRQEPDYVVVGDAGKDYTFENMNAAFNLLREGADLIAMEKDRFWMTSEGLVLSAGPYVAALEYATGKKALLTGKPSKEFFDLALSDMKAAAKDTTVIGDDLETDIRGAHEAGMRGLLVKTGKHRIEDVEKSNVVPDAVLESIAELKRIIK